MLHFLIFFYQSSFWVSKKKMSCCFWKVSKNIFDSTPCFSFSCCQLFQYIFSCMIQRTLFYVFNLSFEKYLVSSSLRFCKKKSPQKILDSLEFFSIPFLLNLFSFFCVLSFCLLSLLLLFLFSFFLHVCFSLFALSMFLSFCLSSLSLLFFFFFFSMLPPCLFALFMLIYSLLCFFCLCLFLFFDFLDLCYLFFVFFVEKSLIFWIGHLSLWNFFGSIVFFCFVPFRHTEREQGRFSILRGSQNIPPDWVLPQCNLETR